MRSWLLDGRCRHNAMQGNRLLGAKCPSQVHRREPVEHVERGGWRGESDGGSHLHLRRHRRHLCHHGRLWCDGLQKKTSSTSFCSSSLVYACHCDSGLSQRKLFFGQHQRELDALPSFQWATSSAQYFQRRSGCSDCLRRPGSCGVAVLRGRSQGGPDGGPRRSENDGSIRIPSTPCSRTSSAQSPPPGARDSLDRGREGVQQQGAGSDEIRRRGSRKQTEASRAGCSLTQQSWMVRKASIGVQLCQSQVNISNKQGHKSQREIVTSALSRSGSVQSVETVGNSEGTNTSNGTETSGASQTPSCRLHLCAAAKVRMSIFH